MTAGKREIRILTSDDLQDIPDPEWLVESIFQRDSLAAVVGNRNTFKTFLMLDVGLSVATGTPWQGQFPVRQGNVLHIVGEGGRGIKRRHNAWLVAHDLTIADLDSRWRCTVEAIDLMTEAEEIVAAIKQAYSDGHVDLLILDTFERNCSGDENSTEQMKVFVKKLDDVVRAFPITTTARGRFAGIARSMAR
jgi:RecA-family ATPase